MTTIGRSATLPTHHVAHVPKATPEKTAPRAAGFSTCWRRKARMYFDATATTPERAITAAWVGSARTDTGPLINARMSAVMREDSGLERTLQRRAKARLAR